jgi:hypothetical protein
VDQVPEPIYGAILGARSGNSQKTSLGPFSRKLLTLPTQLWYGPARIKPFWWEAKQSWPVDVPASRSKTGKRQRKLFPTRDKAREFCGDHKAEHREHGRSGVTAEQQEWIAFAQRQLGDWSQLPEVIGFGKRNGARLVPIETTAAVKRFTEAVRRD